MFSHVETSYLRCEFLDDLVDTNHENRKKKQTKTVKLINFSKLSAFTYSLRDFYISLIIHNF